MQDSSVFKTRLINTRHFYTMTKTSKKQLHILQIRCHKQGITILGKIQTVSKEIWCDSESHESTRTQYLTDGSKDCYLQRRAEKNAIETDMNGFNACSRERNTFRVFRRKKTL